MFGYAVVVVVGGWLGTFLVVAENDMDARILASDMLAGYEGVQIIAANPLPKGVYTMASKISANAIKTEIDAANQKGE